MTHHRTKFEFFTDLSTKSGFDNQLYDKAHEIINNSVSKKFTKKSELISFFNLRKSKPQFSTKRKDNHIEASLKALNLNNVNQTIKKRNGYSEIIDSNGRLLAKISGPGQYGISFAYVEPQNTGESPLRYALRDGEKIFQYTSKSGRTQFLKNYNNAVKANRIEV